MISPANILRVIINRLNNRSLTKGPTNEMSFLISLPEPRNMIERSYYQYLCQMKKISTFKRFFMNAIAIPGYVYLLFNKKLYSHDKNHYALFLNNNIKIIPYHLYCQYNDIYQIKEIQSFADSDVSKSLLSEIGSMYGWSIYFRFKCALKLYWYDSLVEKYTPSAIFSTCEYSFTSSVLTEYCHRRNIKHINIMHGEKLLDIHDSFFAFDKCYVWDEYYVRLFEELRAEKGQFVVSIPESLLFNKKQNFDIVYDYVYYLQNENGEILKKICEKMKVLKAAGARVAIRLHPLCSIKNAEKYLEGIIVEEPSIVPIEQSIMQTNNAISLYSTVLLQAYFNGVGVVIDDITSPEIYENLSEYKYIICQKPHRLFSEIVNNCK